MENYREEERQKKVYGVVTFYLLQKHRHMNWREHALLTIFMKKESHDDSFQILPSNSFRRLYQITFCLIALSFKKIHVNLLRKWKVIFFNTHTLFLPSTTYDIYVKCFCIFHKFCLKICGKTKRNFFFFFSPPFFMCHI